MASPHNRRRATRVSPGRLRVAMHEQNGVLVDISESGACIGLTLAEVSDTVMSFILKWEQDILLRGRVVRAWVDQAQPRIGVEFVSLPRHSAGQLQQLILAAS
jgi:hypothetical protein